MKATWMCAAALLSLVACSAERAPRGMGSNGNSPMPGAGGSGGQTAGAGGDTSTPPDEDCHNAVDDDGDGLVDCDDSSCDDICNNPCAAPVVLSDPGDFFGSMVGFASLGGTSCASEPAGATNVFQVTATKDGFLDAYLAASDDDTNLTLSVRSSCSDPAAERVCAEAVVGHEEPAQEHARARVSAGETVYIVVQGYSALDAGSYVLTVASRTPICGDGRLDPGEGCDDGGTSDGDGCSAMCVFTGNELEPNDAPGDANGFTTPWFGQVAPADDVDFVVFNVPTAHYGVLIATHDLGDGSCASAKLDSSLELFDAQMSFVASDDNSGDGLCSRIIARDLAAGDHLLAVTASPFGPDGHTFLYKLLIEGDTCGNGTVGGPEECDDHNLANGDGCSQWCTKE